jgi:hypothetical protein
MVGLERRFLRRVQESRMTASVLMTRIAMNVCGAFCRVSTAKKTRTTALRRSL